jgi:hypothetical protein
VVRHFIYCLVSVSFSIERGNVTSDFLETLQSVYKGTNVSVILLLDLVVNKLLLCQKLFTSEIFYLGLPLKASYEAVKNCFIFFHLRI